MVGFLTERIERNRALDAEGIKAIPSTTREVAGASFDDAIVRNPGTSLGRESFRDTEDALAQGLDRGSLRQEGAMVRDTETGRLLDTRSRGDIPMPRIIEPDEANETFGIPGQLKFDAPIADTVAGQLNHLKRDELQRQDIFRRAEGGAGQMAAQIGTGLLASVLDPINVASAFIPVVGPARYALWLDRAGSAGARAGVRAAVGGLEGAVGAAVVEPLVYMTAKSEQADYDAVDSLLNVAFGTVLGGGLHAGGGAIGDRITGRFTRAVDAMPVEAKETALRGAIAQMAQGEPVDIRAALLRQELLSGTTLARRSIEYTPDPLALATTPDAPPAAPAARVLLPAAERDEGYVTFTTADEAGQAAARLERRTGEPVEVAPQDGGFVLMRESDIDPVRSPDGTPTLFASERAATRYIADIMKAEPEGVAVVPAGKGQWAIVKNADERDIAAMKARPNLIDFGRTADQSAATLGARQAETRRAARADFEQSIQDLVRRQSVGYMAPNDAAVAEEIGRLAGKISAVVETPEFRAQSSLAEAQAALDIETQRLDLARQEGLVDEADEAALKEADDMIQLADRRAKAYEAGAACMAGKTP